MEPRGRHSPASVSDTHSAAVRGGGRSCRRAQAPPSSPLPSRSPPALPQGTVRRRSRTAHPGPRGQQPPRNAPSDLQLGVFKEKMHRLSSHLEIKRTVDSKLKYHMRPRLCPLTPEKRRAGVARSIYLCPGAFPGTPPPPRSRRRCFATFFLAAEESPTSEGLQTERFWSLAEEKLAGSQCSWQTLGGLHCSICRREQKGVCLHRLLAPPPRRPPPAQRHYRRGWALQGVRLPGRSECKCYVIHYQM